MKPLLSIKVITSKLLITLQFISWCWFFALPAINAQGQINGHWVSLCTTQGPQILLLQSDQDDQLTQHHLNNGCPCVQHALNTASVPFIPSVAVNQYFYFPATTAETIQTYFPTPLARAPPASLSS